MSTSKDTVAAILEDLSPLRVRARAMFGEYVVYCDEKVVALVCDDRFYLKPTVAAAALAVRLEPCPPYPGAKDCLLVDERLMRDGAQFRQLVQATAEELPARKPKRKKAKTMKKAKATAKRRGAPRKKK